MTSPKIEIEGEYLSVVSPLENDCSLVQSSKDDIMRGLSPDELSESIELVADRRLSLLRCGRNMKLTCCQTIDESLSPAFSLW
jgi:hypothetical protein